MAIYSIRDLEALSGVKAHTIRIWEKRYGLLQPQRTETNIRYYLDQDLKTLLNTALLNRHGFKISKIASMSDEDLHQAVLSLSTDTLAPEIQSDALTLAMLDMDEQKFDSTIRQRIHELGFRSTMTEVIFPFLDRLNLLWMTGSIAPIQENFIAGLIKQKIWSAIDQLPMYGQSRYSFILFLPEGEDHELSILFIHYLLRDYGLKVVNIGRNVTIDDLLLAYKTHQPTHIFTLINEGRFRMSVREFLDKITLHCRNSTILVSGAQVNKHQLKNNCQYYIFDGLDDIMAYLDSLTLPA